MRIDYLEIRSPWKNLGGFSVDFDETRDVAVIIGRNGSAKSNLLEAVIWIFRNIDLGEPALFSYELRYKFEDKNVVVTAEIGKFPAGKVNDESVALDALRDDWSPRHLVGYYSGVSDRFEELFRKHDLLARNLTLTPPSSSSSKSDKLQLRQYVCARPIHGLFALLAFYLSKDKGVDEFLLDMPRIESFDSALLVIHKPSWARKGFGPDKFWGAKGPVLDLLKCMRKNSLAPFSLKRRVKLDFSKSKTRELIYLYLPDLQALQAVAGEYGDDPCAFFQALDTMRLSDLIEDFRVRVRVAGVKDAIHTRQLSEGEQQILSVLGLMRFTRNSESLYLLDEPDTHLNPAWSVQYLEILRKIGGIEKRSHTLIATHDPLLVSGLCRQEIRALTRLSNGRVTAAEPEKDPRGTGVAGVLTSPLYGLESQLDGFSLSVLKRIYEVSFWDQSPGKTRHLARLRKLLPAIETAETSPDPYRNIARDAYQLAQEDVLKMDEPGDRKKRIIDKLATKLIEEATEGLS